MNETLNQLADLLACEYALDKTRLDAYVHGQTVSLLATSDEQGGGWTLGLNDAPVASFDKTRAFDASAAFLAVVNNLRG